jgi:hypothetical protein
LRMVCRCSSGLTFEDRRAFSVALVGAFKTHYELAMLTS